MSCVITGSIVTFNNMKTIKKTLDSLFKFADDDFKLYIIDNGSIDGTVEFINNNYSDKNIEIIQNKNNIGFGAGHNVAIKKINSDYHAIINPDIVFVENVFKKMSDYMNENKNIGLLSPRICFPDGRNQILGKRNPRIKYLVASRMRNDDNPSRLLSEYAMLDCDISKPTQIENASGCFMFVRTDVLKKLGGFDERYFMYFEDADLSRQINEVSTVVYYPDAVVNHVWGRDSKRNLKLMKIHIQSMFKYFIKWKTI